ncbi:MAG: efflux RND transporter periplasmic adaptor subunit [Vicinamibacterales bacterium]|nr:efflux RND transporter periplasmic adaptor subunit [Vicinamibacterales bacterium]
MMRKLVLVPTLVLATALVAAGCRSETPTAAAEPDGPAPALDVAAVRATPGTIEAAIELSGTLAPRARVGVKPRMPGTLDSVLVDLGDHVRLGQVIATIDRRQIDAEVDAAGASVQVAQAGLASAEAALANAETEQARASSLFESGALPRQRLETADTGLRAAVAQRDLARASVAQAEAAARRAREMQKNATLTSPVAGHIVARHYDAGAMPGDLPVVVVADMREMKLEVGVSELEAGRLRLGLPAVVTVQARPGETFTGRLAAIAPEVDERNRHFRIEVRVDNPDQTLLSGMYATVRVVLDTAHEVLTLPREAVATREGQSVAMRITGSDVAPTPVETGLADGRRVQILSGLAAGDVVLADARRQLPAGARVNPIVTP